MNDDSKRRFVNGREVTPPKGRTSEQIKADYESFWCDENERLLKQATDYPEEVAAAASRVAKLMPFDSPTMLHETSVNAVARELQEIREAGRKRDAKRAAAKSAEKRSDTAKRDARVRAAHAAGTCSKKIAKKNRLSVSQVNRILAKSTM